MEVSRASVLKWLNSEKKSQIWLSQKCDVSKQAVSNWLREKNPQAISAAAEIIIRKLMEESVAASQTKPPHHLVLEFTDDEYINIEQAALNKRLSAREWAKRALLEIAGENDLAGITENDLREFLAEEEKKKAEIKALPDVDNGNSSISTSA